MDESLTAGREPLIVASQTPETDQPAEGPLNLPTVALDLKAPFWFGNFDRFSVHEFPVVLGVNRWEMRGNCLWSPSKRKGAPLRSTRLAVCTFTLRGKPCVSTRRCRLRPQIFFSAIEATLDASDWTGFDRLTIDDGCTRFFLSVHGPACLFAQAVHGVFPGVV